MKPFFAVLAFAACTPCVAAQQQSARPSPVDPTAPVAQAKYDSPFTGYTPYREQELAPWREVNEEVARVGGHAGVFGGAGHAAHGAAKSGPMKPAPGQSAAKKEEAAGQPPVRSAPLAPQGGHKGH